MEEQVEDSAIKKLERPKKHRSFLIFMKYDELVNSPKCRHPGEGRGPEHLENTGFRPSPE
jgi:hypothetical protein